MAKIIEYPIYGNEEDFASIKTGEIVKASRAIGYKRCLTKNAKKDLYDKYGVLYMSALSAIRQFNPACCANIFLALCELTQEQTNIINYSIKGLSNMTWFSQRTIIRAMKPLKESNIIMELKNDLNETITYMNPLVLSKMSKEDRFDFYTKNNCVILFAPEFFRKELL